MDNPPTIETKTATYISGNYVDNILVTMLLNYETSCVAVSGVTMAEILTARKARDNGAFNDATDVWTNKTLNNLVVVVSDSDGDLEYFIFNNVKKTS